MTDPDLVGIAGDWHGNTLWAVSAIKQICSRLEGEREKIILHAGDLGVWHPPGEEKLVFRGMEGTRQSYLSAVNAALSENSAALWFVEGNHEDHPMLAELREQSEWGKMQGWITSRIRWLQRGTRWEWNEKKWLALGGAVSVDRLARKEGISWFPEEEITDAQEESAISGGPADVILSHDAPASEPLNLGVPVDLWLPMIPKAEMHRERMERVCRMVKPSLILHGHYHRSHDRLMRAPWGICRFIALDMDGTQGNWGILDTRTMDWEW